MCIQKYAEIQWKQGCCDSFVKVNGVCTCDKGKRLNSGVCEDHFTIDPSFFSRGKIEFYVDDTTDQLEIKI